MSLMHFYIIQIKKAKLSWTLLMQSEFFASILKLF